MKLYQLNEYKFTDKNSDYVKIGDAVLFMVDGLGGQDGWTKGIIASINGDSITVNNLEAKPGEPLTVSVREWKKIDKL